MPTGRWHTRWLVLQGWKTITQNLLHGYKQQRLLQSEQLSIMADTEQYLVCLALFSGRAAVWQKAYDHDPGCQKWKLKVYTHTHTHTHTSVDHCLTQIVKKFFSNEVDASCWSAVILPHFVNTCACTLCKNWIQQDFYITNTELSGLHLLLF